MTTDERNWQIALEFKAGSNVAKLAAKYRLKQKTIEEIIRRFLKWDW